MVAATPMSSSSRPSSADSATLNPKIGTTQYAYYPLTLFDGMWESAGVVTGWFVEGLLDKDEIEAALNRLMNKWPMLSGRLEINSKFLNTIKIPMGPLPEGYVPYVFTSRNSEEPISHYVKLPLPIGHDVLPTSLFLDPCAPRNSLQWAKEHLPLTYWHLTYFRHPGQEYTCIGISFPHGLLDGMGIAAVIHALEAETLGKEWKVPPPLQVGLNENKMQIYLDRTQHEMQEKGQKLDTDYRAVSIVGAWFVICFLMWNFWQQVWHKASRYVILVPPKAYEKLVNDARTAMIQEGKKDVRLSTGDVLTAWLYKTLYSKESNLNRKIHLSNMASLRMFSDAGLDLYAHNCFIPINYPNFTVSELQNIPVHSLAYALASARSSISIQHAIQVYHCIQEVVKPNQDPLRNALPCDATADEEFRMSNMSIARVVDIDWSGVGGGRTICRYKDLLNLFPFLVSNVVTIAGRLHDGSTVLDVVLNEKRKKILEDEVIRLIAEAGEK